MSSRKRKNEQKNLGGRPKKIKRGVEGGRKRVSTENCSTSTKYRRAREVKDFAESNADILEVALNLTKKSDSNENAQLDAEEACQSNMVKHTVESAFAFFLEHDFTEESYSALSKDCKSRKCPIYPSYYKISKVMAECRPKLEDYAKADLGMEIFVPLQIMLNKTAERLCNAVTLDWNTDDLKDLKLMVTLGFDSSSGYKNVHQKCKNPDNESVDAQQHLFVTSFIIIKISSNTSEDKSWVNPTPQSTRFCRTLRLALEKETDETATSEYDRVTKEIDNLVPFKFQLLNEKSVCVSYEVTQTLFDGKCFNAVVKNKATSRCPICRETTHAFGKLKNKFTAVEGTLNFGLGLLHVEIKTFEHLLHISYRKTLQTWDIRQPLKGM